MAGDMKEGGEMSMGEISPNFGITEKWLQVKNWRNLQKIAGHCNLLANFWFVSLIFLSIFW